MLETLVYYWPHILFVTHWLLVVICAARILSKRQPTGVALAWIMLISSIPIAGPLMYLVFGEWWLSGRRMKMTAQHTKKIHEHLHRLQPLLEKQLTLNHPIAEDLTRLTASAGLVHTLPGNAVELFNGATAAFNRLTADIDSASRQVDMLFYIWAGGPRVDAIEAALINAVKRGVKCRVLVDSSGSKQWLRSPNVEKLRTAGVEVREALQVRLYRVPAARIDLRNHRKLVLIDETIAYSGSLNMADPTVFKADAGVGAWVDLMARVQGPAVAVLDSVFELDWSLETGEDPFHNVEEQTICERCGDAPLLVVPSGPGLNPDLLHQLLLQAIYGARETMVISTPYFVPDESMLTALIAAAQRGVKVTLIVPRKVDSWLVQMASHAYYDDLLDAGAEVMLYDGGLLHAKTVTIDGSVAFLGTVNMDRRSFWINLELSLFVFNDSVCQQLCAIQQNYMDDSRLLRDTDWVNRGKAYRICENAVQLLSPVL